MNVSESIRIFAIHFGGIYAQWVDTPQISDLELEREAQTNSFFRESLTKLDHDFKTGFISKTLTPLELNYINSSVLDSIYSKQKSNPFTLICAYGHTKFAQTYDDMFSKLTDDNYTQPFSAACSNGHIETARWLYDEFNPFIKVNGLFRLFTSVCQRGYLDVAKFLYAEFPSIELTINGDKHDAMVGNTMKSMCSSYVDLTDTMVWLIENVFGPFAIQYAAKMNKHKVIERVLHKYDNVEELFKIAFVENALDVASLLYEKYPDIGVNSNFFINSFKHMTLQTIEWLYTHNRHNLEVVSYGTMWEACTHNKLDIVKWLVETHMLNDVKELAATVEAACTTGATKILEYLFSIEDVRENFNCKDALTRAALLNSASTADFLLKSFYYRDSELTEVFITACQADAVDVVKLIVSANRVDIHVNDLQALREARRQHATRTYRWMLQEYLKYAW